MVSCMMLDLMEYYITARDISNAIREISSNVTLLVWLTVHVDRMDTQLCPLRLVSLRSLLQISWRTLHFLCIASLLHLYIGTINGAYEHVQ